MFPILYENIVAGTVPQHYGLGVLSDALSVKVEQERNSIYELTMEYPANGIHAQDLAYRRVLKVKPNFTDNPQLFRIDRIGKTMNGKFTVYAKHISYDLSGYFIKEGVANNIGSACELLQKATKTHGEEGDPDFTIGTTKSTVANFNVSTPSSVKSWFGGKSGSILDVYGGADIKYDNFSVVFKALYPAVNRGVTIRYAKNLLELSQELDCSNLYTDVVSYYKNEEVTVTGNKVSTGLVLDVPRVLVVDATAEFTLTAPTSTDLDNYSTNYIAGHNLTVPSNNIKLDFVQSGELKDRVDLCDEVTIYYEALGISTTAKCVRTVWDCLLEKYVETEFGDIRQDLSDTLVSNKAAVDEAVTDANAAIVAVASKKRVFVNRPFPPYDVGDLWINEGQIYVCNKARPAGYIRLIGTTTTPIEEGSTTSTITVDGNPHEAAAGDVVEYGGEAFIWFEYYDEDSGTYRGLWTDYIQYIYTDWELATNYVNEDVLQASIKSASEIITGGVGGYVILHCSNPDPTKEYNPPDELLIVNNTDISQATEVWRWNKGGLGFANSYSSDNYYFALTVDPVTGRGAINANLITVGELDASKIIVSHLSASMFEGGEIVLGGYQGINGKLTVKNGAGVVIGTIDENGLEFFGETVNNVTPSVVFDKNGMTGYSNKDQKATSKIFWTYANEFCMKNAVVKEVASFGNKIKFVPIQTATNNGIAIVGVVR